MRWQLNCIHAFFTPNQIFIHKGDNNEKSNIIVDNKL